MTCTEYPAIALLAVCFAFPLMGQSGTDAAATSGCIANAEQRDSERMMFQGLRILEDFGTHRCWFLERDLRWPAAPASLVPLPAGQSCRLPATARSAISQTRSILVIRSGDTLVLVEHTSLVDARLEAIALSSAGLGEELTVRLKTGGPTLRAIATAPGRGSLVTKTSETRQ